ncbi:hypothetical protein Q8F55_006825 [Vanrija albida]|uniref:Major facilitator superfamily (MFS) profile domain-containing protein n=1 Tax=Vanrija albida TaxID=181172 RepID=A0ABR3PY58_9TREE
MTHRLERLPSRDETLALLEGRRDSGSSDASTPSYRSTDGTPLLAAPAWREPREPTWKGRLWDTFDLPPAERKLLNKVDALLLTFASLGYFLKNLDQTNIHNAFFSGMKEDLGMHGDELVHAVTVWTVGYAIGQIPSNMVLTRVSPRYVIPTLEFLWGLATLASYRVTSYQSLYALRFLVGLFESAYYPGILYLLGGWYTSREIGKRAMIFWLAGSVGGIVSGFLQAAAFKHFDGVYGLAGWRWLFVLDAIITLPVAVLGFFFLPGNPLNDAKEWWLTQEEHDLAVERMRRVGRTGKKPWTRGRLRALFTSWHIYVLPFVYVFWNNGGIHSALPYWMKTFNNDPPPVPGVSFTIPQINTLPLVATGFTIVGGLSYAWLSDGVFGGRRWPFIYTGVLGSLTFAFLLKDLPLYDDIPLHFALYWSMGVFHAAGPLILAWFNEILAGDNEKRALVVALGNDFAYVVQAIGPNIYWKTSDFPEAKKGYRAVIVYAVLLALWTGLTLYLLERDRRRDARAAAYGSPRLDESESAVTIRTYRGAGEDYAAGSSDTKARLE